MLWTKKLLLLDELHRTDGKQSEAKTTMLKDGKIGFQLVNMNIDMESRKSTIDVLVVGLREKPETVLAKQALVVKASVKPFINLVWMGTVFALGGLFMAMVVRRKESDSVLIVHSNGRSRKKTHSGVSPAKDTLIQEPQQALEEGKP